MKNEAEHESWTRLKIYEELYGPIGTWPTVPAALPDKPIPENVLRHLLGLEPR